MKMWQKMAVAGIVASSLALWTLPALAQTNSPWIDQREANQQNRINQGANSGQINPQEYKRLENRQNRINAAEARMKSDGHYTCQERARTRTMLNRSSRQVYRAKHNNRVN
jgi:chorismate mutase